MTSWARRDGGEGSGQTSQHQVRGVRGKGSESQHQSCSEHERRAAAPPSLSGSRAKHLLPPPGFGKLKKLRGSQSQVSRSVAGASSRTSLLGEMLLAAPSPVGGDHRLCSARPPAAPSWWYGTVPGLCRELDTHVNP